MFPDLSYGPVWEGEGGGGGGGLDPGKTAREGYWRREKKGREVGDRFDRGKIRP